MDLLPYLFGVVVFLAALLASIGIWSRRRLWVKLAAVVATMFFIPAAYAGYVGLLSKPKPVEFEWAQRTTEEATVLGATIREGKGIYLWLQMSGLAEPRSYVLPWDIDLAQELQEAMREAQENGSGLMMRLPFEPSLDEEEAKFYALPQPALPPKDFMPETKPEEYRHPSLQI
ncbi:MAG: hypothetical protein V3V17_01295 [Alphaproteobacteria bacterium]